ncbi:MAG: hypothetical protein ACE5R6_12995 [Candidatus Heimdallarchaeota archaeon]
MHSKEHITNLLQDLKMAETIADRPQLIDTIHKLGDLKEHARKAIPHLLALFTQNYETPALRNALKTAFEKIGFDITPYERFEKLRLPTRLLLLFGLLLLNGTIFGWGSAKYYPYDYDYISKIGPRITEVLSSDQVILTKGNYYWMLVIFLVAALFCLFYLAYLLYLFRPLSSFPITNFWTPVGLIFPLFFLLVGIFSAKQTPESWILFPSKPSFYQLMTLGLLSSLWCFLVNLQFTTFVNGFLRGTLIYTQSHQNSVASPPK